MLSFFGCVLQVKKLTRHLYPNAHGKINFKDFCHAVFAIKGEQQQVVSKGGVVRVKAQKRPRVSSCPEASQSLAVWIHGSRFLAAGCEGILKAAVGPRLVSRHPSVTDNGYMYQV